MFKLDWEKAEEPEIKLPISVVLSKKQEFQKNIYFCFIDYAKAFDSVDPNKLWKTGLLIAAIMAIIAITIAPVAEIALYQMVQTTTSVQECLKNACSSWEAQSHIDEEINNRLVDLENAVLLLGEEVQNLKSQIH